MKGIITFILVAGIMFPQASNSSTTSLPEHELHAMMVYNFSKHFKWPNEREEFVIGVMGDDKVFDVLKTWYGNRVRMGKKVKVVNFTELTDVSACNILYLGSDASGFFESVQSRIAGRPTLFVTAGAGLGEKGSSINFRSDDNKLKFELNQEAIDQANLKVSSRLASLAILV